MGGRPRGDTVVRHDGFGILKQMFAKGYAAGNAAEATFPEYVQRPRAADSAEVQVTFSEQAGRSFYDQIETAIETGDREPLVDFSRMPEGWRVPAPAPEIREKRRAARR
jgi:hypothetical protein